MTNKIEALDAGGFNEMALCRTGPMVYNKNDVYVGGSLSKYGEFSVAEQMVFRQLVREGMLVAEIGANIGAHTIDLRDWSVVPVSCMCSSLSASCSRRCAPIWPSTSVRTYLPIRAQWEPRWVRSMSRRWIIPCGLTLAGFRLPGQRWARGATGHPG